MLLIVLLAYKSQAQNEQFIMTQVGPNKFLDVQWDLHYGPDDYLWVTERSSGKVIRVNPATGAKDELIKISGVSSTAAQDGLLGIALEDEILGQQPYVYLSYTYLLQGQRRQRIARYTYSISGDDGVLFSPQTLIENLPASNDHNSGRLLFGPDKKLYYTIGDQGNNQNSNYCQPILAQVLPTQAEIDQKDWHNYPGKVLRLNLDGTIPEDNPTFAGVRSHIFTHGHRNPQGLVFGQNGILYSDEHGPNSDDEVNIISGGKNYGWPFVVGFKDNQLYDYCDWSSVSNCASLKYVNGDCPPNATFLEESSFRAPNYQEPIFSMFAVTDDYDYKNPNCQNEWICRPNVAPSSIMIYESDAIPAFKYSLMVISLKRGRVYHLKLNEEGTAIVGDTTQLFYTQNRYRDMVVAPDGKTFFILTDVSGNTSGPTGLTVTGTLKNPGTILKFSLKEVVAVEDETAESVFQIQPNPASSSMNLQISANFAEACSAQLINSTGQLVKSISGLKSGINQVDLEGFTPGIYIVRLNAKNKYWQQRLIIQ